MKGGGVFLTWRWWRIAAGRSPQFYSPLWITNNVRILQPISSGYLHLSLVFSVVLVLSLCPPVLPPLLSISSQGASCQKYKLCPLWLVRGQIKVSSISDTTSLLLPLSLLSSPSLASLRTTIRVFEGHKHPHTLVETHTHTSRQSCRCNLPYQGKSGGGCGSAEGLYIYFLLSVFSSVYLSVFLSWLSPPAIKVLDARPWERSITMKERIIIRAR